MSDQIMSSTGKATTKWNPLDEPPTPTVRHIEVFSDEPKSSQEPIYATGANRNLEPNLGKDEDRQLGFWARRKKHFRRYWYYYVALAIILLGAGLPILFLVIVPAIAQRVVDSAALPIQSARLVNPSPGTIDISMIATIKVPLGLSATLHPFTLNLIGQGSNPAAYIALNMPEYHLKGNSTIAVADQTVKILDMALFETFLKSAVYHDEFTLSVSGEADAYFGKLKAHVKLNKNVQLTGLNNLTGFGISTAEIVLPAEPDGTNLVGTAIIPNHSLMSFALGNVTLNMIVGGILLGNATLPNAFLVPGNNSLPLRAIVDFKLILSNFQEILASQASALASGNLEIQASGNSTFFDGQELKYMENVLNPLTLSAQIPVATILAGFANSSNPLLKEIGDLFSKTYG